jgi:non-homologous end joining protein Ku
LTPTAEPEHKIIDIMAALKASLAAGKKPAQSAPPAEKKPAKAKAKRGAK